MVNKNFKEIVASKFRSYQSPRIYRAMGRPKFTAQRAEQLRTVKRFGRMLFPMLPASSAQVQSATGSSSSRGRGRPRGSYKYPGGVYNYRKLIRSINSQRKIAAQMAQIDMLKDVANRTAVANAMASQQIMPPQQAQMQMPQQQTQQLPQRRPVATVFKGSGGSPYPPVSPVPLQQDRSSQYYEDTDAFTGQKIVRKRPEPEAWIR